MLPRDTFRTYEPRAVYPVFADRDNRIAYVLRETYIADPRAALRHAAGRLLRRDHHVAPAFLSRIVLDSIRGIRLRFRGAFLDRDGNLLATVPVFAETAYGQGFEISLNALMEDAGIPIRNAQFLLIADRGVKLDGGYSIGTVTAAYGGETGFTCYRNAAFARPVNEFAHHRPVGFRSIAPHMACFGEIEASAYFFNFSSDPDYAFTANPTVRLLRDDGQSLEAAFGSIPPFGARERSLSELFGPEVRDFLDGQYGTLIAEQDGVTIGSVHIIRNRKTRSMGIEHTRPTHMYVT
ncbi:MAG: hypothetical protein VW547_00205 [Alphaproteobacteria bacterium]